MATRKASSKAATVAPVLSDKEIVKQKFKDARAEKIGEKFLILDKKDGVPVFPGLSKTEADAWKRSAHLVL